MALVSTRPQLVLTDEERRSVDQLRQSKTASFRDVQRAQILWLYSVGETVSQIARTLNMTRKSVLKWIDKALQIGADVGIEDTPHKPREAVITDDAKAWVVHLACSKPKEFGYAAELWTRSALAQHVRQHAVQAGYPALANAAKATVQRILDGQTLQPHKVKYYMERRDADFLAKMRNVLLVYQEVELKNEAARNGLPLSLIITVSVDEKPGVQAIANTTPDLPPRAGAYPTVGRDPHYTRLVTWSISGESGSSRRACYCARRGTAQERGVHRVTEGSGCLLPGGVHDSGDSGQPFVPPVQRDTRLSGNPPQPVQVRAHAHARFLAEHRGDLVWQDDPDVPEADSRAIEE